MFIVKRKECHTQVAKKAKGCMQVIDTKGHVHAASERSCTTAIK